MPRVLSTIVLLGLLAASAAAFAITEHLKLIKSPIYATHVTGVFSPVCNCATDKAVVGFKLRHSDTVTVKIVSGGHVVATLVNGAAEQKGRVVEFAWNGRTSTSALAPDGTYQPQVELKNDRSTILMPNKITVDTVAPKVLSASDGNGRLVAGAKNGLAIRYAFDGRGRAHIYLGGRALILGRHKLPQGGVRWNGKVGGNGLPPGRYVLEVAAVDKAGNETPPGGRKRVVVRISAITLGVASIHVRAGARFTVVVHTGAKRYTWKLAGKRGAGTKPRLHLRAPSKRGRYRLVVSEHGHSTTARVIVGKK